MAAKGRQGGAPSLPPGQVPKAPPLPPRASHGQGGGTLSHQLDVTLAMMTAHASGSETPPSSGPRAASVADARANRAAASADCSATHWSEGETSSDSPPPAAPPPRAAAGCAAAPPPDPDALAMKWVYKSRGGGRGEGGGHVK